MVYVSTKQIDSSQEGLTFDVKPRMARGFDCLLTFFSASYPVSVFISKMQFM
jgi:hypothetical protein